MKRKNDIHDIHDVQIKQEHSNLAKKINFTKFIVTLKKEYNRELQAKMWHVNLNIDTSKSEIKFTIDKKKETRKLRGYILYTLGKPLETQIYKRTENDEEITYKYSLE